MRTRFCPGVHETRGSPGRRKRMLLQWKHNAASHFPRFCTVRRRIFVQQEWDRDFGCRADRSVGTAGAAVCMNDVVSGACLRPPSVSVREFCKALRRKVVYRKKFKTHRRASPEIFRLDNLIRDLDDREANPTRCRRWAREAENVGTTHLHTYEEAASFSRRSVSGGTSKAHNENNHPKAIVVPRLVTPAVKNERAVRVCVCVCVVVPTRTTTTTQDKRKQP